MTIGIGVLGSTKPRPHVPRPDGLVMISDTMGSTPYDSTDELHKMLINDEARLYAVCAGRLEKSADLWPMIVREFSGLTVRNHGGFLQKLNKAVIDHRAQHFQYDIIGPRHMVVPGQIDDRQHESMMQDFQQYDIGASMLVGTFDDQGQSFLYYIGPLYGVSGFVHLFEFPGHYAIGTGAYNAEMWLNYRQQVLGLSVKQSAYHAYEAKRMAARAPTVNDDIEILIAVPNQSFHLTRQEPEKSGCPISLTEMEELFKKYETPKTAGLGHPNN